MSELFDTILSQTLRLEYVCGDLTSVPHPIDTGWRNLPCLMLSYQKIGSCDIFLKNTPSQLAGKRELIVIPPGIPHRIVGRRPASYNWVHLNFYVLGNLDLFTFVKIPPVIRKKTADRIGDLIKDWIVFYRKSSPNAPITLNARRNEICFGILRELAAHIEPYPEQQSRLKFIHAIQPALNHIHQNFVTLSGRDELADRCNLSAAQFHRLFFQAMSVSPMQYVRTLRIRHAQQLLISTDLPVNEIASRSGYSDPFIFSRAFKKHCGQSPIHYRQKMKANILP